MIKFPLHLGASNLPRDHLSGSLDDQHCELHYIIHLAFASQQPMAAHHSNLARRIEIWCVLCYPRVAFLHSGFYIHC